MRKGTGVIVMSTRPQEVGPPPSPQLLPSGRHGKMVYLPCLPGNPGKPGEGHISGKEKGPD